MESRLTSTNFCDFKSTEVLLYQRVIFPAGRCGGKDFLSNVTDVDVDRRQFSGADVVVVVVVIVVVGGMYFNYFYPVHSLC